MNWNDRVQEMSMFDIRCTVRIDHYEVQGPCPLGA
jgi:hypothetical protein